MTKTSNDNIEGGADAYLTSPLFRIRLLLPMDTPKEQVENISLCLDDMALATSYFKKPTHETGPWEVEWIVDFTPDRKEISDIITIAINKEALNNINLDEEVLAMESVVQVDWLEQCYHQFEPFEVGGFYIYGSHYKEELPKNLTGLQIDAATAFGSGEHGTTKGCLLALEKLVEKKFTPKNILDMGAGSGILAIAGYKRYKVPTLAVDNDRESVRVAAVHRDLNNLTEDNIRSVFGDGYATKEVQDDKKFDLIFANILAGPLKKMAPDLAKCLADDGYVILSGLLEDQADAVLEAHTEQGLELVDRINIDGWSTLSLKK